MVNLFNTPSRAKTSKAKASAGNAFTKAITATPKRVKTANGAATFESTLSDLVDLFAIMGSSRGKDISVLFGKALAEDENRAMRMLFWGRDVTEGAGERQTFRNLLKYLEKTKSGRNALTKVVHLVPVYGRWDDLLHFSSQEVKDAAYDFIYQALMIKGDALCAKWMPRKGAVAVELREFFGLSPKQYRKLLVNHSNTVETLMCAKQFEKINFSHVPSVAAARYQKAFSRNAPDAYKAYRDALTSKDKVVRSTVKINAKAIFPHDVFRTIFKGDVDVGKAQWEALPNYLKNSEGILPLIDSSGSMGSWNYYGYNHYAVSGSVQPIEIAVTLGLYIAEKQKGAFQNVVCNFDSNSQLHVLKGDIVKKAEQISRLPWGGSTNIEAAFNEILKLAVQNNVPQKDMPKTLLIISDMEFNSCTRGTAYETVRAKYTQAGYKLPRIVFWNVNGREGNNPVTHTQDGTALISGYSPAIMKSVMSGGLKQFTPQAIMDETIMGKRYDAVTKALAAEEAVTLTKTASAKGAQKKKTSTKKAETLTKKVASKTKAPVKKVSAAKPKATTKKK